VLRGRKGRAKPVGRPYDRYSDPVSDHAEPQVQRDQPSREPGVVVRLLGPVAVSGPAGTAVVGSRVQQVLLAMLALHPGRLVGVDELMQAAWGDEPPLTVTSALRVHVAHVRRALAAGAAVGSVLQHRGRGYVVDPIAVGCDVLALERLVDRVQALSAQGRHGQALAAWEQGLALWSGRALQGLEDVEALGQEARRLEDLRARVQEEAIEARLLLGHHEAACADATAMVQEAPLRERRTAQLMLALYRTGRQAEALRACRRLRERLLAELGVDPAPEVQRLEGAILRQEPELAWTAAEAPPSRPLTLRPARTAAAVPHALRALVADRVTSLSQDQLRLVRVLAVVRGESDLATLAGATELAAADLAQVLSGTDGLVDVSDDGSVRLRHELFAEALLAELPEQERRRRHADAARGLERAGDDAALAAAAWHRLAAVPEVAALQACRLAARAADVRLAAHDSDAARTLCREALRVQEQHAAPDAVRVDLLTRLTEAEAMRGDFGAAQAAWAEAVERARRLADAERFALAVLSRGWARRTVVVEGVDDDLLREALDRLGDRPTALRIRVASALLSEAAVPGRARDVRVLAEEVSRTAPLVGDQRAQVAAFHALHVLLRPSPDAAARADQGRLLLTSASLLGDAYWLGVAELAAAFDAFVVGDVHDVARRLESLRRHSAGARSSRLEWHVALTEATVHRVAGRFSRADRYADTAAVCGAAAGIPDALAAAVVHRFLVDLQVDDVSGHVPLLLAYVADQPGNTLARAAAALALAHAARLDEAATAVDAVLAAVCQNPPDEASTLCLALAAEAVAVLPDAATRARGLRQLLEPYSGQVVVFGQVAAAFGPVDRTLALLYATEGDAARAALLLDAAADLSRRMLARPWELWCGVDRLRLLRFTGQDAEAEQLGARLAGEVRRHGLLGLARSLATD